MRPSRATLHPGLGPREDDGEDEREQRPAHRCLPRGPRAQPPPERVVSDPLLGEADGDGVGSCRVCCEAVTLGVKGDNGDGALGEDEKEVVLLGCRCSQPCHRACIEEWCRVKGDRTCEICGETMRNLREPPPRAHPEAPTAASGDDFTVVMQTEDGLRGERLIVITQTTEPDADGGGVTVHRYYASPGGRDDSRGAGGRVDGEEWEWSDQTGWRLAAACVSDGVYLLCFFAVFLLLFGAPGAVMAGMYLAWYVCMRATFANFA